MDLKGHLQLFLQRSLFRKYLNYSRPDSVEKYFNCVWGFCSRPQCAVQISAVEDWVQGLRMGSHINIETGIIRVHSVLCWGYHGPKCASRLTDVCE